MATAFETARYFLSLSPWLTIQNLHELCFFAQGVNLATLDAPLFGEQIEVHASGPFVRDAGFSARLHLEATDFDVRPFSMQERLVLAGVIQNYQPGFSRRLLTADMVNGVLSPELLKQLFDKHPLVELFRRASKVEVPESVGQTLSAEEFFRAIGEEK